MQCLDMIWTQRILPNCTWKVNANQISQHKRSDIMKTILTMQSFLKHNLVQFYLFPHRHFPVQENTISQTALSQCFFKLRTWHNCFLLKFRTTTKCLKGPFQFQAEVLLKVEHLLEGSRKETFSCFRHWERVSLPFELLPNHRLSNSH